jgi:nicotinamide-nucleotide amidase
VTAAAEAVDALRAAKATVATAESLTGGLVCATLVSVPGASDVVRGGVVAYAAEVKIAALGVPEVLVAERGTVDADVAAAMAAGVRDRLGATYGVSTTGVAGPGPSEGKPGLRGSRRGCSTCPATATRSARGRSTRCCRGWSLG